MKTIITGASGFVGQNLTAFLSLNNVDTIGFGRSSLLENNLAISDRTSGIVHLAGKAHDLKKTANPQEYYDVNYKLTKKLYQAFLTSQATKFIFISSVKAAADNIDGILTEDVVPKPQTDYGKSKLMAEEYIRSVPLPIGKSYFILRPCMIHGPGNKGNLNLLFKFVKKGIPYPLSAFNNQRSFLSIGNLCYVIKELLYRNDIPSGVYNMADDEPLSTSEVVGILAESLGKSPKLWNIPKPFLYAIAKMGDILKLPLNTERLTKLTDDYVVSNQKIKVALSSNLPVKTREGLMKTAKSFKIV